MDLEQKFSEIVARIFNNWTALKLAVEHSMGGPNSKQIAIDFLNYTVQYCLYEKNVDANGIEEAIEDILDEEFHTTCEDGSPKEIAQILYKFFVLLKQGNREECETEFNKLPVVNSDWLNVNSKVEMRAVNLDDSDSDSEDDDDKNVHVPMEEDEWIEVKSRRKR